MAQFTEYLAKEIERNTKLYIDDIQKVYTAIHYLSGVTGKDFYEIKDSLSAVFSKVDDLSEEIDLMLADFES